MNPSILVKKNSPGRVGDQHPLVKYELWYRVYMMGVLMSSHQIFAVQSPTDKKYLVWAGFRYKE